MSDQKHHHSLKLEHEQVEELKTRVSETKERVGESVAATTERVTDSARRTVTKSIRKTRQLSFYLFKFGFRIALFLLVFILYLTNYDFLDSLINQPFFYGITPLHVVWGLFMALMISHLIPNNRLTMAWRKARESEYVPVEGYDELELLRYVQSQNRKAWKVMLVWLSFNGIFGILYLAGVLRAGDLVMLTVFFFLSDYICILLYCPFQSNIMKNKCCINCRIYDWGHFMIFTPMLFIQDFFSWSLFFTACVVLIHWEIQYARYPERFWEGSNRTLQCAHCKEQTCQIKKKLQRI